jgi:hypothetical protein
MAGGTVTIDLELYDALRRRADQFGTLEQERMRALYNESHLRFPDVEDGPAQSAQIDGRRKFYDTHEAIIRVLVVPKTPETK